MPRPRIVNDQEPSYPSLRFPVEAVRNAQPVSDGEQSSLDALEALESVSRRIDDLARELNCLGWFDDDDRPRAA